MAAYGIRLSSIRQELRPICKTRNQFTGYSRAQPTAQAGRDEVLPQAAEGIDRRAAGDHHRQAEKLRGRAAGDTAWDGASPTPVPQQPCRELPPAHPPAGAAHAGVYVTGSRAAVPLSLWSHRPALAPTTPPLPCVHLPSREAAKISPLAGPHGCTDRSIGNATQTIMPPYPSKSCRQVIELISIDSMLGLQRK